MRKIRAAIVGYGNIGKYTLQALNAAPDFEVAGVVRRSGAENLPVELEGYNVVKDIRELGDVDVAILSTPTRSVEKYAKDILALGINTVDSFDIHSKILDLRRSLGESAEAGNLSNTNSAIDINFRNLILCSKIADCVAIEINRTIQVDIGVCSKCNTFGSKDSEVFTKGVITGSAERANCVGSYFLNVISNFAISILC